MKRLRAFVTTIIAVGVLAGSTIGALAQSENMAPAVVDGTCGWDQCQGPGGIEASDPRLTGRGGVAQHMEAPASYTLFDDSGDMLAEFIPWIERWEITNDGGSWTGINNALETAQGEDLENFDYSGFVVLQGEGGYEGLGAYLIVDYTTEPPSFRGAIFPGLPELTAG